MKRTWTQTGAEYTSGDDRERVERAIEALQWEPVAGSKPMMPALGISEAIKQLRLPKVTQIAISGASLDYPDGDDGIAYYALYGIECNYADGRCRVYLLDEGSKLTVLASDFWPRDREAVTA